MSEKATKDPPYDFHKAAYEVAQAPNVICSGMMSKQDRKMGVVWRKRFFILLENPSSSNTPSSPRNQYTPSIQVLSNNNTTTTTTGLSATTSPSLLSSSSSSSSTSLGVSSASSSSSVRSNRHFSMNMSGLQAAAAASSSQQLFTNSGASSTNNHDIILYYFKSPTDTVSISSINVRFGVESVETIQYTKVRKYGLKIVTKNQREYLLCCDEESEQSKWLNHLTLAKKGSALSKSSENLSQPISVSTPLLTGSPKVIHRHIQSSIPLGVFNAISSPSTATTPLVKKDESYNRWHDWCLNQCQIGCKVIKLPYLASCSGVEKKRFLQLSKDAKVIRWGTTTIHKSTSKISQEEDTRIHQSLDRHINMSQVTAVHYGVSSNTFQRYLEKVMTSYEATNCISFVVKTNNGASRTIDLIFLNSDDAMAWYLLLTVFKSTTSTPTQSTDQIIADFKWSRLRLSVQQRCFLNQTSLVNFMEEQVYLLQ